MLGLLLSYGIVQAVLSLKLQDGAEEFLGHPEISQLAVAVTVGILVIIGLVAGIFPALKAARLEPVESLRYE